MTVNRGILFRLAVVLAGANLIGIGFAVATDGMAHATVHIVLAAGFGFWAMRLRRLAGGGGDLARMKDEMEQQAIALEDAQFTLSNQTRELAELQERVDFAERMLIKARERLPLEKKEKPE
jgi:hypothetical protein